jgi:hypothetical protein
MCVGGHQYSFLELIAPDLKKGDLLQRPGGNKKKKKKAEKADTPTTITTSNCL